MSTAADPDGLAGAAPHLSAAASTEVIVTFFQDWGARTKTEERLTLGALAELIRTTTAPAKDALPWLIFARVGTLPSKGGSLRWNGNVRDLSGVVSDYDGEKMRIDEAVERLDKAGVTALVYSSPSHMWDGHGPRWRVCCPFSAPLPPDQHCRMMSRLNGILGGALASESWTLSQAYYYGAVQDRPEPHIEIVDGTATLDRCEELDETAIGKPNGSANGHDRAPGNPEAPIEDIVAAMEVIPNDDLDWPSWNTIGMAVWRASGGSEKVFEAFDRWSRKSPKYDAEETRFRWDHYQTSPPGQVGFGTLVHLARQGQPRWEPPSRRKFDFDAAKAALEGEPEVGVVDLFVRLVLQGEPDPVEIEQLLKIAAKRTGISRTAIKARLNTARAKAKPKGASSGRPQSRFTIEDGCLAYLKSISTPPAKLANFSARIVEDQLFDDGATEVRRYLIEGELDDGTPLPHVTVPVKEFAGAAWVDKYWVAKAIVYSDIGTRMLSRQSKQ